MTCAEFQKVLPYFIDGGGTEEEQQHLATCPVCSDLVADLRYIAECRQVAGADGRPESASLE